MPMGAAAIERALGGSVPVDVYDADSDADVYDDDDE